MGNCIAVRVANFSGGLPGPDGTIYAELKYPSSVRLKRRKPSTLLHLPAASSSVCTSLPPIALSAAVLPSLDPLGHSLKPCQDVVFYQVLPQDAVLIGVFDGHGCNGLQVVRFAKEYVLSAFLRKDWRSDPQAFLHATTKDLDAALLRQSGPWDAKVSGTTQVLVLVSEGRVYTANVGDSRLVMGTKRPFVAAGQRETENGLLDLLKKRTVSIEQSIKAVQLTKDQKPSDPHEQSRIHSMGGCVRRLTNSVGQHIGPWRVWKKGKGTPGLAISRSLGDADAKAIGVTSDPVVTAFEVRKADDRFLVAATDGVWDVMDNSEVVAFVESYRSSCLKFLPSACRSSTVDPSNCSIAQLLCEEARVRWLALAEAQDVVIDDISCVVLEFDSRVSNED